MLFFPNTMLFINVSPVYIPIVFFALRLAGIFTHGALLEQTHLQVSTKHTVLS